MPLFEDEPTVVNGVLRANQLAINNKIEQNQTCNSADFISIHANPRPRTTGVNTRTPQGDTSVSTVKHQDKEKPKSKFNNWMYKKNNPIPIVTTRRQNVVYIYEQ